MRDKCDFMYVRAAKLEYGEDIVDTVGAGDAFVGSFVAGVASDKSLVECLKRGLHGGDAGVYQGGSAGWDTFGGCGREAERECCR